jgi:prepilin-type processing-associated H-X9-DG protein/prepilin-type N-terminal cleavage/methylation domain-containing protein
MHYASPCPRTRLRAVTLVELLTVIAVIGILAAILIPTVGRVRESGRQAKCLSNLRNLAGALMLSAQDNRGFLPMAIDETRPVDNRNWMQQLDSTFGRWSFNTGATGTKNPEIYFCPSSGRTGQGTWPENNPCYGVNNLVMGSKFVDSSGKEIGNKIRTPLNKIDAPSRLVLIGDTSGTTGVMSGEFRLNGEGFLINGFPAGLSSLPQSYPAPRHPPPSGTSYAGRSFNVAFADGHVEKIATSDPRLATVEGRGRMFRP